MLLVMVRSVLDLVQTSLRWLLQSVKNTLWKILAVFLIFISMLWLSAFMYGTFYYSYMPSVSVLKPVHFQFSPCEAGSKSKDHICSYPSANVSLQENELLMRGQRYRILLQLELPESHVNEKIGMFMVTLKLYNRESQIVATSSRATILRYRSPLLQTLHTLFFSALYLSGMEEQKQSLDVELFSDYVDDAVNPCVGALIEIQNKKIQFYSARLNVHAYFTGLRYIMYHWPILSAIVGTFGNLATLTAIALMSWYRYCLHKKPHALMVGDGPDEALSMDDRRKIIRARLDQEKIDEQLRTSPSNARGQLSAPAVRPDLNVSNVDSADRTPSETPPSEERPEDDVATAVMTPVTADTVAADDAADDTPDDTPDDAVDDSPDEPAIVTLGSQEYTDRGESQIRQRYPVMVEE